MSEDLEDDRVEKMKQRSPEPTDRDRENFYKHFCNIKGRNVNVLAVRSYMDTRPIRLCHLVEFIRKLVPGNSVCICEPILASGGNNFAYLQDWVEKSSISEEERKKYKIESE